MNILHDINCHQGWKEATPKYPGSPSFSQRFSKYIQVAMDCGYAIFTPIHWGLILPRFWHCLGFPAGTEPEKVESHLSLSTNSVSLISGLAHKVSAQDSWMILIRASTLETAFPTALLLYYLYSKRVCLIHVLVVFQSQSSHIFPILSCCTI